MTFILAPGKVNYTQGKAYCHISLLSFMQKTMQKLVTKNIMDETLGHVTYTNNNLPTNKASPQEPQLCDYTYTESSVKTLSYTWYFLDIMGATDSTSFDKTKVSKWHGLGDTL